MGYIWGSFYNIPKATFYLLKGDYSPKMPRVHREHISAERIQIGTREPHGPKVCAMSKWRAMAEHEVHG